MQLPSFCTGQDTLSVVWCGRGVSSPTPRLTLCDCRGGLWKQAKMYPATAGCDMPRTVHLQTRYRGTTYRRDTEDCRAFGIDAKVLLPGVTPRMEQSHLDLACLVLPHLKVRLEKVAGMAGQGEILEVVRTAMRLWKDMFYLERKVEDGFRRMTVFATVHRAFGNNRVQWVHGWRRRMRLSVRATVASSSASMRVSSSARSAAVSVARRVSSSCIRSYCAAVKYASG